MGSGIRRNFELDTSGTHFPKILHYEDQQEDCRAYVVIDSLIQGRSAGGIRMSEEVSELEVAQLARNMTIKFGFANVYYGGAKSGICIQQPLTQDRKQKILERVRPGICRGYSPSTSINRPKILGQALMML